MSVGVGLRVGNALSSVAVTSATPGRPDPEPIERQTAVHLHSDGTATLGEHDVFDGTTSSFTDFVERIGRSGGVRANDGALSRAEDLVATAVECLLADAAPLIGDGGYTAVATYPTDWPPSTVAVLRNALDYVGLRHVSLISDAEAAAAWFESQVSHQTGRLVAVYHIDPHGSTITLVRSGVAAGKAFRFVEGDAPSISTQLSTALGAFGWLVSNLDAIVVTVDETVDPSAAQIVTQAIKSSLGLRCALAPVPHQTMVRGAAVAAAAGSVDLLGSTQVLPMARAVGPIRSDLDPETTVVIAKITADPPEDPPARAGTAAPSGTTPPPAPGEAAAVDDSRDRRRSSWFTAGAAAAAIALLVGVGALVFALRDVSTANADTHPVDTSDTTTSQPSTSVQPPPPTTTTATSTEETVDATTEAWVEPDTALTDEATWYPTTDNSTTDDSTTRSSTRKPTTSGSTTSNTTTSRTGWSRYNQPDPTDDTSDSSSSDDSSSTRPSTRSTEPEPEPETETAETTETDAADDDSDAGAGTA